MDRGHVHDGVEISSSVTEEYLQVIHQMTRDRQPVIAARLAERLSVSPPTVTATLKRMQRDGLVEHGPRKEIILTERGRQAAEDTVRRHALAERLMTDLLKLSWHEAHEVSHGIEHAITPKLEARLMQVLGNPTTCPHGNPIPGIGALAEDEFPLDRAQTGDDLLIVRITEEAETDVDLMRYLQEHSVEPGMHVRVSEANDFNALVVLEGDKGSIALGFPAAAKIRARHAVPVAA
jgi:DtxR family Mn-dependent transcriptional regulator